MATHDSNATAKDPKSSENATLFLYIIEIPESKPANNVSACTYGVNDLQAQNCFRSHIECSPLVEVNASALSRRGSLKLSFFFILTLTSASNSIN
mmetsp:Transcript_505/g.705  ORF Transcript_505/g.705 Transcript_505/m.705 type:complete len:95 (+) Transcript_505:380-664(+)